jgi:hypothetical protein
MSLACGSLSCSSVCGASRSSAGFEQQRGIAGVRSRGQVRLRRQGFWVASAVGKMVLNAAFCVSVMLNCDPHVFQCVAAIGIRFQGGC